MIALKTLLFTVLVPGSVTLLLPFWILSGEGGVALQPLGPRRLVALLVIGLGGALYLRCAFDFTTAGRGTPAPIDPPTRLVVRGPYRFSRNPMYVGVLGVLLGEVLFTASLRLAVYVAVVFACFQSFIVLYEEPALTRLFGAEYRDYRARVPRWLGRVRSGP